MPPRAAALVLGLTALVCAAPATADSHQRFFKTAAPLRASCELDVGLPGLPTQASCLVLPRDPALIVSARLSAGGVVHTCRGLRCAANPPEQVPLLAVGHSLALGPFRCTALAAAVRCVVAKTGGGFVLRASGVQRL